MKSIFIASLYKDGLRLPDPCYLGIIAIDDPMLQNELLKLQDYEHFDSGDGFKEAKPTDFYGVMDETTTGSKMEFYEEFS